MSLPLMEKFYIGQNLVKKWRENNNEIGLNLETNLVCGDIPPSMLRIVPKKFGLPFGSSSAEDDLWKMTWQLIVICMKTLLPCISLIWLISTSMRQTQV